LLSNELPGREAKTFTDILNSRARTHADKRGYVFLRDGEDEEESLTFGQLHQAALAVAARLSSLGQAGERAILLYPPGLSFIVSFFGCLYAGIVPVPVSVPSRRTGLEIVRGIALDSGAKWLLSASPLLEKFGADLEADPHIRQLPRFNTDEWRTQASGVDALRSSDPAGPALLQYTSGSTGTPRGVIVTHSNLVNNHREYAASLGQDERSVMVSWLPMFHDMGLGTVLWALWLGVPCILMAPTAFLQQPARWLKAISRYRATWSGGPDFAYDLCARRLSAAEREGLDLSSWNVAFNGSEPVRAATLDHFAEVFAACGFRRECFHPVYGLA
jgi:acyl-CoA synthetase (AMP-forming)/AMP-acid ligase II